ncbi:MAG TPA: hypothetical protein VIF60_12050 [Burkholderiaceae bacterium]
MPGKLTIADQVVPLGDIKLTFRYFPDERPPHALVDILSDSSDDSLGGVAINCLNVGDILAPDGLTGLAFSRDFFSDSGFAVGESVFWRNGDDVLEMRSLSITFGKNAHDTIEVEIRASCFSFAPRSDIPVSIVASAKIE